MKVNLHRYLPLQTSSERRIERDAPEEVEAKPSVPHSEEDYYCSLSKASRDTLMDSLKVGR